MESSVYYDASSANVYTLNATYNTVKAETDPSSIPAFGSPSGRSALVNRSFSACSHRARRERGEL